MADLPSPVNTEQAYLAAILGAINAQTEALGEIRDRLGQAETPPGDESTGAETSGPTPVDLREPDSGPAMPDPEPAADDKPAPKRRGRTTKGSRS